MIDSQQQQPIQVTARSDAISFQVWLISIALLVWPMFLFVWQLKK